MKLHYEPTVRLVSKPTFANDIGLTCKELGNTDWLMGSDATEPDLIPELAGRLCYLSFDSPRPGGNVKYLDRIKGEGHGSVFEHVTFGLLFTGVSRSLTHELVRHRAGVAYSQLSQRYVDESVAEYVVPWELRNAVKEGVAFMDHEEQGEWGKEKLSYWEDINAHNFFERGSPVHRGIKWLRDVAYAHEGYVEQVGLIVKELEIKHGVRHHADGTFREVISTYPHELKTTIRKAARGAARSLLPNATETKILVTANVRSWRNMLEMRCHPKADAEIRMAMHKAYKLLVQFAPNLFADYTEVPIEDGTTALETPTRKV